MISQDVLLRKINNLPPARIDEVVDFVDFLADRESTAQKTELAALIAEYASENAGTEFDLDEEFEKAGIDHLRTIDGVPQ
ncbi:MAG: toxin-antitoxin system, antitoxin component, Xre family protein [Saprospiraceae bacterium]|nr:toxin-antitoxin system, antitoxin component, Xre family protein [Pyrinomonadaceae bacterium]